MTSVVEAKRSPLSPEEIARGIRQEEARRIIDLIASGEITNPLRAMKFLVEGTRIRCGENEVPSGIVDLTIGDISPLSLRRELKEIGVEDLDERLGLRADGPMAERLRDDGRELAKLCESKGRPLTNYDVTGQGEQIVREKMVLWCGGFGLIPEWQQLHLSYGGMDAIERSFRTARGCLVKKGLPHEALFPVPGFIVTKKVAEDEGVKINMVETTRENDFFLTPQQAEKALERNPQIRIIVLTPINNPTALACDPERLAEVLRAFKRAHQKIKSSDENRLIFMVDAAYMPMVEFSRAVGIVKAFRETDTLQDSLWCLSISKAFAVPGTRGGGIVAFGEELLKALKDDTLTHNPTVAKGVQEEVYARLNLVSRRARKDLIGVLKGRQEVLIRSLRRLDEALSDLGKTRLFEDLSPYLKPGGGTIFDNPLYVYLPLAEGVTPWSLFAETGLAGAGEKVFGCSGENQMIRFSVGLNSTLELKTIGL